MSTGFNESPLFRTRSRRHHYIPKFLVDGFVNERGLLFVYDKRKDYILRSERPPKSIFFEFDRNTVPLKDGLTTSILEDHLYNVMDNDAAAIIRAYREKDLKEINFETNETSAILFFLINLFWRIPATDFAVSDLMDRSEIKSPGIDPEALRVNPAYRKMMRAGLFKHHIDQMREFSTPGRSLINIHSTEYPIFLIGDNPIVFKETPTEFSKFGETDLLFPLGSQRIYTSTQKSFKLTKQVALLINAAIIDKSKYHVASHSKDVLEASLNLYRQLKEKWMLYELTKFLFDQHGNTQS